MSAKGFYPPIAEENVTKAWLPVSGGHEIYVEESGNPRGIPVVFLHGGPGIGAKPGQRCFFDPEKYRILLLAQRGSPPSRWKDAVHENTTWHLVDDLEKMREHFNVDRWLVFGGSWGSTLALAYAQTHPERVLGLILRGIYLARPGDSAFFFHDEQDPESAWPEWKAIRALVPGVPSQQMDEALFRIMTGPDQALKLKARRAWKLYSDSIYTAHYERPEDVSEESMANDPQPEIEALYAWKHGFFREPSELVNRVDRIRKIPSFIVHGVQDRCVPVEGARTLSRAWPEARYVEVDGGGHGADDPLILPHLIQATDSFESGRPF